VEVEDLFGLVGSSSISSSSSSSLSVTGELERLLLCIELDGNLSKLMSLKNLKTFSLVFFFNEKQKN
jgi:hypothetical protein